MKYKKLEKHKTNTTNCVRAYAYVAARERIDYTSLSTSTEELPQWEETRSVEHGAGGAWASPAKNHFCYFRQFTDILPLSGGSMTEPGDNGLQGEAGRRPAIVVSNDTFNRFAKTAAMVSPITSKERDIPLHVKLRQSTHIRGVIMCDQAKILDVQKHNAEWIEKAPDDLSLEVVDIITGFIEING